MTTVSETLWARCEEYLRFLRVERQLSPLTIANYQRQLRAICAFFTAASLNDWAQLTPPLIRSMAATSRREGLKSLKSGI